MGKERFGHNKNVGIHLFCYKSYKNKGLCNCLYAFTWKYIGAKQSISFFPIIQFWVYQPFF